MGNEDVRVTRAGEIIASREFYDYDDKYVLGLAETVAPTDLTDSPAARAASSWSRSAYRALRVEGLARIDVFLREDDEIVINEVNTMPGFTPISMFPMLWEAEGVSFQAVVEELVPLARRSPRPATSPCAPTACSEAVGPASPLRGSGGGGDGRAAGGSPRGVMPGSTRST